MYDALLFENRGLKLTTLQDCIKMTRIPGYFIEGSGAGRTGYIIISSGIGRTDYVLSSGIERTDCIMSCDAKRTDYMEDEMPGRDYTRLHHITITILDNTHRPVFYLKHDISKTGFCLCLHIHLLSWAQ
jgi:hypothetical protein